MDFLKESLLIENIKLQKIQEYNGIVCMKASFENESLFFVLTENSLEILARDENIIFPIDDLNMISEKIKKILTKRE